MHERRLGREAIDDLLLYEDVEFAQRAYRMLLGREADTAGLTAQVAKLRDGSISKLQLLESLQSANENDGRGAQIADVTRLRSAERITNAMASIPLVGRAFNWLWTLVRAPQLHRQQQRTIALLGQQLSEQHEQAAERERALLGVMRAQYGALEDRLIAQSPRATTDTGRVARFYAEFQDHFRGSREQIRERLDRYVKYAEVFRATGLPVIDLGCGRGLVIKRTELELYTQPHLKVTPKRIHARSVDTVILIGEVLADHDQRHVGFEVDATAQTHRGPTGAIREDGAGRGRAKQARLHLRQRLARRDENAALDETEVDG